MMLVFARPRRHTAARLGAIGAMGAFALVCVLPSGTPLPAGAEQPGLNPAAQEGPETEGLRIALSISDKEGDPLAFAPISVCVAGSAAIEYEGAPHEPGAALLYLTSDEAGNASFDASELPAGPYEIRVYPTGNADDGYACYPVDLDGSSPLSCILSVDEDMLFDGGSDTGQPTQPGGGDPGDAEDVQEAEDPSEGQDQAAGGAGEPSGPDEGAGADPATDGTADETPGAKESGSTDDAPSFPDGPDMTHAEETGMPVAGGTSSDPFEVLLAVAREQQEKYGAAAIVATDEATGRISYR